MPPNSISVRQDAAKISTLHDLIGKRVGVLANSGGAAVIETYNKNRGSAIRLFSLRDINRMLSQLSDRQLDAMLLDESVAIWQMEKQPNFTVVGGAISTNCVTAQSSIKMMNLFIKLLTRRSLRLGTRVD